MQFSETTPVPCIPDPMAPRHREWAQDPLWIAAGLADRVFPAELVVDKSVSERMNGQPENLFGTEGPQPAYTPQNLPAALTPALG
ncbi:hypothetical protein [Paraburkholderia sp. UYCP14C]|uniref:hypothetical protein n=1 Tax=Paraburkholderia sp. UYCP14C TaxID=2511130 RepID=UPI001021D0BF|nr:hypothetical protein [Paraburkholderia sp. UYCP14C]